ncbi:MAG: hypothetical protein ACE366_30345 [Bradymonadia bacterium]
MTRHLVTVALLLTALTGCDTGDDAASTEERTSTEAPVYTAVPPEKADDYRSPIASEFRVKGTHRLVLPESDAELTGEALEARVQFLVQKRFQLTSGFLFAYLTRKLSDKPNHGYGGFRSTVREQSFEAMHITPVEGEALTWTFDFEADIAGPDNLMSQLPLDANGWFSLAMMKVDPEVLEHFNGGMFTGFDPRQFEDEWLDSIDLHVSPSPKTPDAFPDYRKLFEDGVFDVSIHVGGDYNEDRWDRRNAFNVFALLQYHLGLTPPVATMEELTFDSGPFTGEIVAGGQTVKIEVYLYYPDMAQDEAGYEKLLDIYRANAAKRDVVIYDGHAGYNDGISGITVSYSPTVTLPIPELTDIDLPEKSQLFMFNGCKSYAGYADALYAHPNKDNTNLDVISTIDFGYLVELPRVSTGVLRHLTQVENGVHVPKSYDQILNDLNTGISAQVMYGVHGLSDNPRRSPWADESTLCSPCETSDACPGEENLCVHVGPVPYCTMACLDDSGCPSGFTCFPIAVSNAKAIIGHQCMPDGLLCGQ